MKKFSTLLLACSLLGGVFGVASINNRIVVSKAVEQEEVYKEMIPGTANNSESIGSYTKSWTIKDETGNPFWQIKNFNNNNNGWNYIKCGSKSSASVGEIGTINSVPEIISKISVTIDAITANNVNSITLYETSAGEVALGTFTKAQGEQEITIPVESRAIGKKYNIKFDCAKAKNGIVQVSKVKLYKQATVNPDLPAVTISSECLNKALNIGDTFAYTATITNGDGASVSWTSSDTTVATIDATSGVATAISIGSTTITATINVAGVDYTDTTTLNVAIAEPDTINTTIADLINNTDGYENGTRKYQLTGVIKGFGTSCTTNHSDALKYGNLFLTDGTNDIYSYGCTGGDATKITFDHTTGMYTFKNGQNFNTLGMTSSLKVGDRLTVECLKSEYNGTIQINSKIISVEANELDHIVVTPNKTEYNLGDTILSSDFSVEAVYTVAGTVTVDSSDCTISPQKLMTAGTNTITISYNGKTATYEVSVVQAVVPIEDLLIMEDGFTMLSTDAPKTLETMIEPENHTETVSFTSNNEEVATVDNNGTITYVGEGTATITLSNEDGSITDSITITCRRGATIGQTYKDVLNREFTGVSNSTTYNEWKDKKSSSPAIYAGNSAGGNGSIQLRGKTNSGIITTSSGGIVKKIAISFNDSTSSGRKVDIYGSNSPYSSASELYSEQTKGILLGTIEKGISTELVINDNYEYVGLRSNDGALYITSLEIEWDCSATATVEELDNIDVFVESLHMDDYNESLGYCNDAEHHYYSDAKDYFEMLTEREKKFFLNAEVNTQYAAAKERLMAWALANGDNLDEATITFVPQSSRFSIFKNENNSAVLITLMSLLFTAGAVQFIAHKRKREE